MTEPLSPVPDCICGPDGIPRFGAYRGVISDGSLRGLGEAYERRGLQRIRSEKRWHYTCIVGPEWVAGLAIVRLGYGAAAFTYLFDRAERRFLVDESTLAPPAIVARIADRPGQGAQSTFRLPGFHASILYPPGLGHYQVRIRTSGRKKAFDLAAELDQTRAPVGLTAICPQAGFGSVNLTVKQVALPAKGRLVVGERSLPFERDTYAVLDYSHGFLDRTSAWMWACAGGRNVRGEAVGLNLVAGFNDSLENALWYKEQLFRVDPVTFQRETGGENAPWSIRSDDGKLDLTFVPEGARSDKRDLGPLSTHYFQPVGTFSGTLTNDAGEQLEIKNLGGVCEEHFSRW